MKVRPNNLGERATQFDAELDASGLILADGSRYIGNHLNGVPQGFGTQIWPDGSRYEGTFKNGLPDGLGLWNSSDGSSYQGDIKANEFHGAGTYVWPDGSSYIGHYVRGKRHGRGLYRWADGSSYDGDFKGDHRHGYGLRIFPTGGRYEGNHVRNKAHGQGVSHLSNGDVYKGGYFNNKRHGYGTYRSKDGTFYKGFFLNGRRHGTGHVTLPDGRELSGSFLNGQPVGELGEKLSSDSYGMNEAVSVKRCDLLSASEAAARQFMQTVDCDFLLIQVGDIWAVLTGEFEDRDKQYWSSIREEEVTAYKYEFLSASFWLVRGVCYYFEPTIASCDSDYIFLFNPIFQEFRLFPRRDFERLISTGDCKEIPATDQIALTTRRAYEISSHRRPSAIQITQIIENERDKIARTRLRFEKSLASRAVVDRYSNLLPVVNKHWLNLKSKNVYGGVIPTTQPPNSDRVQPTLLIGISDLRTSGEESIKAKRSQYICAACASTQVDNVFLTCAVCLAQVCSACSTCEC